MGGSEATYFNNITKLSIKIENISNHMAMAQEGCEYIDQNKKFSVWFIFF
jgi:hypothetical protein